MNEWQRLADNMPPLADAVLRLPHTRQWVLDAHQITAKERIAQLPPLNYRARTPRAIVLDRLHRLVHIWYPPRTCTLKK